MALLQQHDARRDIVIEPAARRRAAIEVRWHSELGTFGRTGGVRNWGRNRAVKKQPACLSVSDRHFYPSSLTHFDETWSQGPYSDLVWPRQ